MTGSKLIGMYVQVINEFGVDSEEANEFIKSNKHIVEFIESVPMINMLIERIDKARENP